MSRALLLVLFLVASPILNTEAAKPDAGDCFMGNCFQDYILSSTQGRSGLINVRVKTTFYCTLGTHCEHSPGEVLFSNYIASCKIPGGFIQRAGQSPMSEPEPDP